MSLRYLAHTLCRLRIRMGRVEDWHVFKDTLRAGEVRWRPLFGGGVSFRELQEASEDRIDVSWLDARPTHAQVSALASCFLTIYDKSLVTLDLAVDVLACAEPGAPGGMFGYMLYFTGRIDEQRPDVPHIFLEAVRRAAWSRRLKLGSNPGDLFITPEVSFLTAPTAVDLLLGLIRKRGHSFTRPDIYQGLGDAGCLVGTRPGARRHTRLARIKSPGWRAAIRVRGLAIANDALWDVQQPPGYFDGTHHPPGLRRDGPPSGVQPFAQVAHFRLEPHQRRAHLPHLRILFSHVCVCACSSRFAASDSRAVTRDSRAFSRRSQASASRMRRSAAALSCAAS